MNKFGITLILFLFLTIPSFAAETEIIGKRPYEMINAQRNVNPHPPLLDFQSIDGWTVETSESEAKLERTREQQLWGDYVAKLTYKAVPSETHEANRVLLKLPQPLEVPTPLDCINFWVYGNNWAWESDTTTPRVNIALVFQGENGQINVHIDTVRWKEWFLIHRKLTETQRKQLGVSPKLLGIEIRDGANKDDRVLYFSDLSFYTEALEPLTYEPRPKRNLELPEGQTLGTNTGPGKLSFPNREETILPTNREKRFENSCSKNDEMQLRYSFRYKAPDGTLVWHYTPKTGMLDDLEFSWNESWNCRLQDAGPVFVQKPQAETKLESLRYDNETKILHAQWKFGEHLVEYDFKIQGKSLMVDVRCKGGVISEIATGKIFGTKSPRLIQVPYLVGNGTNRPSVLVDGDATSPLFYLPQFDHTRSNASELFFANKIEKDDVTVGGAARYKTKTDGKRNDCFERIFLTVSPCFEEVLPNIPNDVSPWRHVTAEHVWRAHGSSNHEHDFNYWKRIHRYGLRKMLICDHEVMWRDGGESYTFRTSAAPGRGGDEGHKQYTKDIHSLGFMYGPYNNYTDYAPVNEYWNEDWVTRLQDGNFQPAWARCYNPKPSISVQIEPKITEIAQKKFQFNTAYCDVHTAVQPWRYVDYDARVPGAGTFAATFYAYGEILLHQKRVWNGPVYSEGDNHWYYSGLTDGNYGQDQPYFVHQSNLPWLIDFDLLKIHPLENNFGMGYMSMFYGSGNLSQMKDKNAALDRFLAATLAFGHTGFLAMEAGMAGGVRAYFTVQQIAKRYGVTNVKSIHYADEDGTFLTTSQALVADKVKLNHIRVEYEDGLILYVNGNPKWPWNCRDENSVNVVIPANGWFVHDKTKTIQARSLEVNSKRLDYVDAPEYLFAEVRDLSGKQQNMPYRFERLLCDKQIIVLKNADEKGRCEMIIGEPNYSARSSVHAVELDHQDDADAVALDFARKEIGKAQTRYSQGKVHVLPVEGAFSYMLTPKKKPEKTMTADTFNVVPGGSVTLYIGDQEYVEKIPLDAKPGTLHWVEKDGLWFDFDVVPLCEITAQIQNEKIVFNVSPNFSKKIAASVTLQHGEKKEKRENIEIHPLPGLALRYDLDAPTEPKTTPWTFRIDGPDGMFIERKYELKSELKFPEFGEFSQRFETGFCRRNGKPEPMDGNSGAHAYLSTVYCGDTQRQGWSLHPPYSGGVGYVFMLSEPVQISDEPGIEFYSEVGIRNGGHTSDGVLYRVFVLESDQEEKPAGEILWKERSWKPLVCDLSPWHGKTVRLRLVADVGPNDNSTADWGCWSEMKLRSTRQKLFHKLNEKP